MTYRTDGLSITLLKTASKATSAMETGERLAKGLKGLVAGSANLGGGIAKGLGAPEALGRAGGVAALGAGAYVGGNRAKQKVEQAKYRLMYGNQGMYY